MYVFSMQEIQGSTETAHANSGNVLEAFYFYCHTMENV